MGNIYKTSRAEIVLVNTNQRFVYALDAENPEVSLTKPLRDFLETMGYSNIFPNFDNIRVGTVHPFAILLAQEVLGNSQDVNVFPSITIADSSLEEDADVLGDGYQALTFTPEDIASLGGYRDAGEIFVSDDGWTKIQAKVDEAGYIIGIKKRYHTMHSLDFNIWADNKAVTSFIFDAVSHFIIQKRIDVHNDHGIDLGRIGGRRSGDINLDFGMLLYGANLRVQSGMDHSAVLFDTSLNSIAEIDVKVYPQYFTF